MKLRKFMKKKQRVKKRSRGKKAKKLRKEKAELLPEPMLGEHLPRENDKVSVTLAMLHKRAQASRPPRALTARSTLPPQLLLETFFVFSPVVAKVAIVVALETQTKRRKRKSTKTKP